MEITQYSKAGNYHISNNMDNQDVIRVTEVEGYILIILADGVTTCENGGKGAELACDAVKDFVRKEGKQIFLFPEKKLAYLLLEHVHRYLEKEVQLMNRTMHPENLPGESLKNYASTLTVICMEIKTGETILFNLGDSIIYEVTEKECRPVFCQKRKYNYSYFTTTEGAYKYADVKRKRMAVGDAFLIASDGFRMIPGIDDTTETLWKRYIQDKNFLKLNEEIERIENKDDCSYVFFERDFT